jgi:hypothetical protein
LKRVFFGCLFAQLTIAFCESIVKVNFANLVAFFKLYNLWLTVLLLRNKRALFIICGLNERLFEVKLGLLIVVASLGTVNTTIPRLVQDELTDQVFLRTAEQVIRVQILAFGTFDTATQCIAH